MKGFRKSLGLYVIEKLEDTGSDVTKKPVEDPASQAPTEDPVEDPASQAPIAEDTAEFVEDTADVLEDTVEDIVDEIDVEPISSSVTKPLEELESSKLTMSNIMLGLGVAIILGVIAFVIFRYVVPKPSTRYSLKYENSLADAVDAINKFDVSVTNTSDFSFDTADVNAISPIEMIN
jgi:hypothetical protein